MRRPDQRGETLVEVVMALGILSLVLVSSYALATGTFRLGRGAGERTQAVNYLQEQAEALRTYRNSTPSWADFQSSMANYAGRTFCMQQSTDPVTSKKAWKPSTADCTRDSIAIAITAQPVVTAGIANQQYNYELTATWKTGREQNNVRLTTKLVRQR
jgi:Tfp pilus assembly protein PilV